MDSERFDRIVRSFGQTRSRRQTLRGLAGAVAIGALAQRGREVRADECKNVGKACKDDHQCCGDLVCVDPDSGTNSPKKNSNTCQQNTPPPNVCDGLTSTNPCFPRDASVCGSSVSGRPCHCGTDIKGNPFCYDLPYCTNPNPNIETQCESNADCEARHGAAGWVCFSAENCCLPGQDGAAATACASPCEVPSA